jgi:uncharacterized protein YkwD
MRKLLGSALVGLALLIAPAAGQAAARIAYQSSNEQQVLLLLNQIRQHNGLGSLVLSAPLRSAARSHSAQMLQDSYFDHSSPGESWNARLARYVTSSMIGEVIAWGRGSSGSPAGLVGQWMRSPAHRHTILMPGLHRVGIGIAIGTFDGNAQAVMATADFAA